MAAKIDLSMFNDLLPEGQKVAKKDSLVDLTDLLPPPLPPEKLGPPIEILLQWERYQCKCGEKYEAPVSRPLTRHDYFKLQGFGYRRVGTICIPFTREQRTQIPHETPVKIETTTTLIDVCQMCVMDPIHPSEAPSPDWLAIWKRMHQCSDQKLLHEIETKLKKRIETKDLREAIDTVMKPEPKDLATLYWEVSVGGGTVDPEAT